MTGSGGGLVAWIVGLASVVSAVIALGGVYLGRRTEIKAERARSARDRKIAGYQGLTLEFFRLREAIRVVATAYPDPEEKDDRTEAARRVGIDWNKAVFEVWMHGSKDVAAHVLKLDRRMNALFVQARLEKFSVGQWEEAREEGQRLMDGYLDIVREELGLPPHKIISDYKK